MGYTANDIRNICLLGHGGDGKSALCESMLFTTKAITRLGKRADGTTVSDFDDEEKKRQYSISTSVIPVEYNKCKINVLDNPGYFDFAGQIVQSLRVSDAGLICLTAKSGIGVGTEKGWKYLAKAGLPAMFYVSKLDEEHANFFNVFDSLREMFGASVIPFTFPILKGEQAVGLVDLIEKKAYDANGKEIPMPAEAEEKIEEYMAELNEQVAETDEALMEKFFMEEPFTAEELLTGIKAGIRDRSVTPVFCGCAYTGLGTTNLLSNLVKFAPNPLEGKAMTQVDEEGNTKEFKVDPKGSPMVFVFNTLADQYGKNSYFKVISGDVEDTMSFVNVRTGDAEKLGNMFFPKGKDNTKTSKICCGDIGVFTKLASVKTGDTLGLAQRYALFTGSHDPVKKLATWRMFSQFGITGIFVCFTGEACVNPDTYEVWLPFTMCHELAHRQTVAAEDGANFCAYLACMENESPEFQYSGAIAAYVYCHNALYKADKTAASEIWADLSDGVRADIQAANEHYAQYEGKVQDAATKVNDTYLKAFSEESGVQSYGEAADLLIAWYLKQA